MSKMGQRNSDIFNPRERELLVGEVFRNELDAVHKELMVAMLEGTDSGK